jgi:hypothetical protein
MVVAFMLMYGAIRESILKLVLGGAEVADIAGDLFDYP